MKKTLFATLLTLLISASLLARNSFRVQVTGGQLVILVPGLSSSGETWDTTVARYKDRFECHVITVAGFAGVLRLDSTEGGMLAKVRDGIVEYVRNNKLSKPVLIGHSLGGFIAMDLAARYPDLPGKVVIIDTYPFTRGLNPNVMPGVEIHVSDTSRHFIMWDDSQWMFGRLERFLASR